MRLTAPDQVKTVLLSDGSSATIRRARGRDLIRAQEIADGDNKFKFTCAMLSQLVQLNGPRVAVNDQHLARLHLCIEIKFESRVLAGAGDFDEPHPRLDEAPGQQALPAEALGGLVADPVQRLRFRRLVRQVHQLGQVLLHAEGQLE